MLWKRCFLYGVPLALVVLCVEAFRSVERARPERTAGEIVIATAELPDDLNPYREGNEIAETVKNCLFDRLFAGDEASGLKPRLAASWDHSVAVRYFFVSKRKAEEALASITAARERWEEWGIADTQVEGDEVRVGFGNAGGGGPAEVLALFEPESVAPVKMLRAQVLQSAWDSYLDFKRHALEAGQVRAEWRESDTVFELAVAGETGNFLREFKSYYDTNNTLGASYRFEEELPWLENSEVLLALREDVRWHDGEPFTSADVVHSFELGGRQPWNAGIREFLEPVRSVTGVDAHTVRIVYRGVEDASRDHWAELPILPAHLPGGEGEEILRESFASHPVGTGPLRLVSRDPGDRLVLGRNDAFFLGSPRTARFVFVSIQDAMERRLRFLAGEIDSYLLDGEEERGIVPEVLCDVLPASVKRDTAARSYRVVRRGALALSRGIGDGHRVEIELEAGPEGIDFHLPWWVGK